MKGMFLRLVVAAGLLLAVTKLPAATFVDYHNFSALSPGGPLGSGTNSDGADLTAGLVSDGVRLYGTTGGGGGAGLGTVYSIGLDGSDFTGLYALPFPSTNGQGPSADLAISGDVLYGTTRAGGTNGLGVVFSINIGTGQFAKLHDFGLAFTGRDPNTGGNINGGGAFPETALVVSSNVLYGATEQGGNGGGGTLFKMDLSGGGFSVLHQFTNADGNFPSQHMVRLGTNLFGTTQFGGTGNGSGNGVIFRINTDGTGFTNLYQFNGTNAAFPVAGLVLSGGVLYGTAGGGSPGPGGAPDGSIFKINPDGSGFGIVYIFDPELDAGDPNSGLAVSGNQIYGTEIGFDAFGGTVFQVSTTGTGYTNLTSFNSPGGAGTLEGLLFANGNLYCTGTGGADNEGEVFKLVLSPVVNQPLTARLADQSIVLSWTNAAVSLYSAPTATGVFTKVAGATSPYTNSTTGAAAFFEIK